MVATVIDFAMHTGDVTELKLTVKDEDAVLVDISGAGTSDIHWIAQPALGDVAGQIYKQIGSGIAFFTDGTDGIVIVSIDAADTEDLDAAATLSWIHQLSVELSSKPRIAAKGDITIDQRLSSTTAVNITGDDFPVTAEYPVGVLSIT